MHHATILLMLAVMNAFPLNEGCYLRRKEGKWGKQKVV
jgi:hypothetical protein